MEISDSMVELVEKCIKDLQFYNSITREQRCILLTDPSYIPMIIERRGASDSREELQDSICAIIRDKEL